MNSQPSTLPRLGAGAAALLLALLPSPAEAKLSRAALSAMRGLYEGNINGTYVESDGVTGVESTLSGAIKYRHNWSKSKRETSDTGRRHRLVYGPRTIKGDRARRVGEYQGSFVNPFSSVTEQVSGKRVVAIRDRGRGKRNRFVLRINDTLREGTLSLRRFRGVLRK